MHTKRRRTTNLKKLPMSKEAYLIQKTPERESLKPASRFATSLAFGWVHHMKKWVEEKKWVKNKWLEKWVEELGEEMKWRSGGRKGVQQQATWLLWIWGCLVKSNDAFFSAEEKNYINIFIIIIIILITMTCNRMDFFETKPNWMITVGLLLFLWPDFTTKIGWFWVFQPSGIRLNAIFCWSKFALCRI